MAGNNGVAKSTGARAAEFHERQVPAQGAAPTGARLAAVTDRRVADSFLVSSETMQLMLNFLSKDEKVQLWVALAQCPPLQQQPASAPDDE